MDAAKNTEQSSQGGPLSEPWKGKQPKTHTTNKKVELSKGVEVQSCLFLLKGKKKERNLHHDKALPYWELGKDE